MKDTHLELRMQRLGITEDKLLEKFILGSGSGGQKINKTSSCVYLRHILSKIEIKCQRTRSRQKNRIYAREELCERLEKIAEKKMMEEKSSKEKIRRQKRRPTRQQRVIMTEDKRRITKKKALRCKPKLED